MESSQKFCPRALQSLLSGVLLSSLLCVLQVRNRFLGFQLAGGKDPRDRIQAVQHRKLSSWRNCG